MKVFVIRAVITLFAATVFSCSMPSANRGKEFPGDENRGMYDINRAPSVMPPHGYKASEVPQFVCFGFNEVGSVEGTQAVLDIFSGKMNPGIGNPAFYDNSKASVTFFNTSYYVMNQASEIADIWRFAYATGHEMANFTARHGHGSSYSIAQWESEINSCTESLTAVLGGTASVKGFKAPYLEYNDNLFTVLKAKGLYDNSIVEGFQADQDGTDFFWPYTLDNGSPGHDVMVGWGSKSPLQSHAGVWEMPLYTVIVPPELRDVMKTRQDSFDVNDGKITGDDYTLWVAFSMKKTEYLATLKHTLDLRLAGNRAPFIIGSNPAYYSDRYSAAKGATPAERREALNEFVDYALAQNVVRVVSIEKALEWIKYPPIPMPFYHTVTINTDNNGTASPSGVMKVEDGNRVVITFTPNAGFMLDRVTVNGLPVTVVNNELVLGYVDSDIIVDAFFTQMTCNKIFVDVSSSAGGGLSREGLIEVESGSSLELYIIPDNNCIAEAILVDGMMVELPADNVLVFNNITAYMTVEVIFKESASHLKGEYKLQQNWGTGFSASLTITNGSTETVHSWKAVLVYAGDEQITGWGGIITQNGRVVTITNQSWNGTVVSGGSVNIGFNGSVVNGTGTPVTIYVE